MTAAELSAAYATKELSPVEVTEALLGRIEALDAQVNAFCLIDAPTTLKQAEESEERWMAGEPLSPLDGVPVAGQGPSAHQRLGDAAGFAHRRRKWSVDGGCTDRRAVARGGRRPSWQGHDPRIRLEGFDGQPAHRNHAQPLEPEENAGRLFRRFVCGAGRAVRAARAGHGRRRFDPHSGELHPRPTASSPASAASAPIRCRRSARSPMSGR